MQNETQNNQQVTKEQLLEIIYHGKLLKGLYSNKMDLISLFNYDVELHKEKDPNLLLNEILGPIFSNNDYFDKSSKNFTSVIVSIENQLFLKNILRTGNENDPDYTRCEYFLNTMEGLDKVINPDVTDETRLDAFIKHYINIPGYTAIIDCIYILNLASIRIDCRLIDKDENCISRSLFIQVNNTDTIERNNFKVYDPELKVIHYYLSALKVFPIPNKPETGKYFKELIPFVLEKLYIPKEHLNNYLDNFAYYLDYYFLYDHVYTRKLVNKYDFLDYTELYQFMFKMNKIRQILDESNYEIIVLQTEFEKDENNKKLEQVLEIGYLIDDNSSILLTELSSDSRNLAYDRIQLFSNDNDSFKNNRPILSIILDLDDKFNDKKDRVTPYNGIRKEMELFIVPKGTKEKLESTLGERALEEIFAEILDIPFTNEMNKIYNDVKEALNPLRLD